MLNFFLQEGDYIKFHYFFFKNLIFSLFPTLWQALAWEFEPQDFFGEP